MQVHIYHKLGANGRIDESSIIPNTHNYLIVPAMCNNRVARRAGQGSPQATGLPAREARP